MVRLDIEEFGRRLRARQLTSAGIVDDCLGQIASEDRRLNAFILVLAEDARRQARESDRELAAGIDRGPLHGVPVSVKDLFDIAGTVTTAASRVRESAVASHDALAVTRLREAGAVIIGKTNLHEFALGTTNEESAFGPARHPLDQSRSPGGSSGGSAVSVAAGMALAALGTDTGGSIRIPAAACGLVGVKPTTGELPTAGVVPLSTTLDHVGPLTHTVADAWHVVHALRGRARARPLSATPAGRIQLGLPRRYFLDALDDDVRALFDSALDTLRRAGARIVEVDIPHASLTPAVYLPIVLADAAAYHAHTLETMSERYTPGVRLRLEAGRYVRAEDYVRALDGCRVLRNEVDSAMAGSDALILPTLPIVAPPIGAITVDVGGTPHPVRNLMLRLTQLFNITGHPAITLPCGRSAAGLPCGLQLAGAFGQTDTLLHVAKGVEDALS
jgi:aspartyl-tRNA(Asn)/glutamyl-tRNA(Gln) amidotransferase subunit A